MHFLLGKKWCTRAYRACSLSCVRQKLHDPSYRLLVREWLKLRKRDLPQPESQCDPGVSVPLTFKLNHLQPFKAILFQKCSICLICLIIILGGQFLVPQRADSEKREFYQKCMRQRVMSFESFGHSNWTIASLQAHFVLIIFHLSQLYIGTPILISPGS